MDCVSDEDIGWYVVVLLLYGIGFVVVFEDGVGKKVKFKLKLKSKVCK